jgi:hypothetical protein
VICRADEYDCGGGRNQRLQVEVLDDGGRAGGGSSDRRMGAGWRQDGLTWLKTVLCLLEDGPWLEYQKNARASADGVERPYSRSGASPLTEPKLTQSPRLGTVGFRPQRSSCSSFSSEQNPSLTPTSSHGSVRIRRSVKLVSSSSDTREGGRNGRRSGRSKAGLSWPGRSCSARFPIQEVGRGRDACKMAGGGEVALSDRTSAGWLAGQSRVVRHVQEELTSLLFLPLLAINRHPERRAGTFRSDDREHRGPSRRDE